MATIWVTGGKGFIGRHLARRLATAGHRVIGVGHGQWTTDEAAAWGFQGWQEGEVDLPILAQLSSLHGLPDQVFHLAGGASVGASFQDPYADFQLTVGSSAALLEWLRLHAPQARVVTVSSAAVYGAGHAGAIDESTPTSPYSPYGAHKLAMEDIANSYARNFGLSIAVVRLFSVYGAGLRKQLVWDLCGKLEASHGAAVTLGGTGNELRDWLHVSDAARLLERVAEYSSDACPVFNGGSGVAISIREVASQIFEAWGVAPELLEFSGEARKGDPFCLLADCRRLGEIGFKPEVDLARGLRDAVSWFKSGAEI